MNIRIFATLAVLLANIVFGMFLLTVLLVIMNGYSESDAQWGLAGFVLLAFIFAIVTSLFSFIFVGSLLHRGFRNLSALAIATVTAVAAGLILQLVGAMIGIIIAEFARTAF